ncbi:MAG TPA: hypothetical protein VJ725_22745 [Thermoanaerobaculia bacterium]|nr:hypothetical protein [Thermoanaerobaculia bacterium]
MPDLDSFLEDLSHTPWIGNARQLETSRARGEIDVRGGTPLKGKLESVIGYPDRMCVTIDTGPIKIRQILNGGNSWIVQNNTVIAANPNVVKTLRNNLFHNLNNLYRFLTDPANREKLSLKADNGHQVVSIDRGGETSDVVFDADLRIREVVFQSAAANGEMADNRISYEEFREWDGLLYPGVVAVSKDGQPLSTIVHSGYEANVDVPSQVFEKPAR